MKNNALFQFFPVAQYFQSFSEESIFVTQPIPL